MLGYGRFTPNFDNIPVILSQSNFIDGIDENYKPAASH